MTDGRNDGAAARQLDALGDATRRRTLELLRDSERSVAELTAQLPVSQSAVSQHLKVLKDAGLVVDRAVGTRRLYRVDLDGMSAVRSYVDRFWDDVLDAFTTFADIAPPQRDRVPTAEPRSKPKPRPTRKPR